MFEIRAVDGADNSIYRWFLREKDELGSQNWYQAVEFPLLGSVGWVGRGFPRLFLELEELEWERPIVWGSAGQAWSVNPGKGSGSAWLFPGGGESVLAFERGRNGTLGCFSIPFNSQPCPSVGTPRGS